MKHLIHILLVLVAITIMACGGGNSFKAQLLHLDSLLVSNPDSVYQVLEGMREEAQQQRKSSRMYYELLRADAQNKAYIDFTTDSVMQEVVKYYDHHGTANEQMRAHYLLGCTYRDLQDVPMELQCFQEAVEKADTTKTDCDWGRLAAIYGQMTDIFHSQFLPEEELNALNLCEYYDIKNNDSIAAAKSYELRLRAYYFFNMPDSVLSITNNVHKRYKELGLDQMAAMMLSPAIDILIKRGQYEEAERYIQEVDLYLGNISKSPILEREEIIFDYHKGNLALHNNQMDSALSCFKRVLAYDKKEAAYKGLLSLYEITGNSDSIAKYAKLYTAENDSDRLNDNAQTVAQMTVMYNYGHQAHIAKVNEIKAKEIHQRLYLYISISIIVLIILFFLGLKIKQSKDKEIIEMTKSYYDLLSQKATLTKEINALTTSQKENIENNKKLLEQKEKEVTALQHIVDSYSCKLNLDDFLKRQKAFESTNIFIRMKQSIRFKDNINKLSNSEWDQFDHLYKQYFPEYYARITKNAQLNNDEKRVCLLLLFCLSPKELSAILNKTKPRISNIRSSINKKLFNVDSAISLDENIRRLF